jgi:hypothetical protein
MAAGASANRSPNARAMYVLLLAPLAHTYTSQQVIGG